LSVGQSRSRISAIIVSSGSKKSFNSDIALLIGVALILNMIAAALAGILVPLTLHKLNVDPALSGAVVLTTVTDVVGFMSFLGLATLFLL